MIFERFGDGERAKSDATAEHVVASELLHIEKVVQHIDCTLSVSVRSGDPSEVAQYLAKEAEAYAKHRGGRWSASHVYSKPLPTDPANGLLYSISMQMMPI
ncbi:hypothetical protein CHKEEEPN_4781 [Methylorubrum podarium]|jgi:hypothetical protein|nr:hypothetical protein CHKEEEPN_4781 [Methylorubrum podarium]